MKNTKGQLGGPRNQVEYIIQVLHPKIDSNIWWNERVFPWYGVEHAKKVLKLLKKQFKGSDVRLIERTTSETDVLVLK